jgi:hypothetical protein
MKEDATSDPIKAVLNESYMMIPDSTKRLQQTADDLAEFLSQQQQQQQVDTAGEWYRTAEVSKRARSGGVREIGQQDT